MIDAAMNVYPFWVLDRKNMHLRNILNSYDFAGVLRALVVNAFSGYRTFFACILLPNMLQDIHHSGKFL